MEIDVHISNDELCRLASVVNPEIDNILPMDIDEDNIQSNINTTISKINKAECYSHILDICLLRIFTYMKTTCHNTDDNLL